MKKDWIRDIVYMMLTVACFAVAVVVVDTMNIRHEAKMAAAAEAEHISERDEAWFAMAEDGEDPLESEHIEQAICELPDKRYPLTDGELYLVCGIVAAESKGEPYEGMMAVAQTILNNCERDNARPADVAWKYATPDDTWSDEVWLAVTAVFWEGQTVTDETILWFYAPAYGVSEWHESQRFVMEVGGHRFFAEVE